MIAIPVMPLDREERYLSFLKEEVFQKSPSCVRSPLGYWFFAPADGYLHHWLENESGDFYIPLCDKGIQGVFDFLIKLQRFLHQKQDQGKVCPDCIARTEQLIKSSNHRVMSAETAVQVD